jgi:hypothetical protein
MGGNAGKVLVSPRNETLEKVHVFCLVWTNSSASAVVWSISIISEPYPLAIAREVGRFVFKWKSFTENDKLLWDINKFPMWEKQAFLI